MDELVTEVPYSFDTQEQLQEYIDRYEIDYIVHGDDPCFTPDGRDVYEHVKAKGMFKAVKRTEGVSTTDIVGRMLTCGMDHLVDDEVLSGKRASDISADDAISAADAVRRSNFLPTSHRIRQFSSNRTPSEKDVVVYMDGAWDMFHQGHIAVLKEAKKLGTFLLVGIQSDETVNSMRGQNLPIMNLHERALGVLSCRYVDEVSHAHCRHETVDGRRHQRQMQQHQLPSTSIRHQHQHQFSRCFYDHRPHHMRRSSLELASRLLRT